MDKKADKQMARSGSIRHHPTATPKCKDFPPPPLYHRKSLAKHSHLLATEAGKQAANII
ncbi:hypothetical protein QJS10_CPA10g00564 [Acorus calamus]|uniref:Uncharacterized protein n=1 Tax=Acorus calamus TaxID=4465 RepID=A0AAV9DXF3_ACOCL|nr:hypothetical protein QJS10_CPA10g00564 [Acorus calamus]